MTRTRRTIAVLFWSLAVALGVLPMTAAAGEGEATPATEAVPVHQANRQQKADAQKAFVDALKHYKAGRYEAALEGFRASHAIVASPNSSLLAARTLAAMGRTYEAYLAAERAAQEGDAAARQGPEFANYGKAADAARKEMDELKAKLAVVTVYVVDVPEPPPPEIPEDPDEEPVKPQEPKLTVAGREIPRSQWGKPIPVKAGTSRIVLVTHLGTETREVTVAPGKQASVTIGHTPPEERAAEKTDEVEEEDKPLFSGGNPDLRVPSYVALGIGGTSLLVFAILGAMSNATYNDLEDQCPNSHCPAELEEDRDEAHGQQVAANVFAIVGALGLTAGAAMFVLGHVDFYEAEHEREQATVPTISIGPGSVSIRGRF